jgi:hypothetical protein
VTDSVADHVRDRAPAIDRRREPQQGELTRKELTELKAELSAEELEELMSELSPSELGALEKEFGPGLFDAG